ncbi:hypothetical protein RHMOL_Rhmol05G0200100 [Rhododendron molle]|uniref:Uncharacterized protein n=1 Tax=Rhododendron molle TaxID=49168 RepID=A0ACC0NQU5_RHOML|nr:hypothetical protein RHMOL_Rhmol05G0200100 [Rhododendron molle]
MHVELLETFLLGSCLLNPSFFRCVSGAVAWSVLHAVGCILSKAERVKTLSLFIFHVESVM